MNIKFIESLPKNWNAWTGLRLFKNEEFVTERLITKHKIPKNQFANAKKQAMQIRFCILQAQEYWEAYNISTIATSPLQLYYCCMFLSIAEILWKVDGNYALDKLRLKHGHHGLSFNWGKTSLSLSDIAIIRAKPHVYEGYRSGTFECWHNFAIEGALAGKSIDKSAGRDQTAPAIIFQSANTRMPLVPEGGLSLLNVYESLPRMQSALSATGFDSKIIRATIQQNVEDCSISGFDIQTTIEIVVHPGNKSAIADFMNQIKISSETMDELKIREYETGVALLMKNYYGNYKISGGMEIPDPISMSAGATYFKPFLPYLNEYGMLYYGSFIFGMLCRYYPEVWMKEIESHSAFIYLADLFLSIVSDRAPLLLLSSLEDSLYISNDIGIKL